MKMRKELQIKYLTSMTNTWTKVLHLQESHSLKRVIMTVARHMSHHRETNPQPMQNIRQSTTQKIQEVIHRINNFNVKGRLIWIQSNNLTLSIILHLIVNKCLPKILVICNLPIHFKAIAKIFLKLVIQVLESGRKLTLLVKSLEKAQG